MKQRTTHFLVLFILSCLSIPASAGVTAVTLKGLTPVSKGNTPVLSDPLLPKHIQYAQYLYGDDWQNHMSEIAQKWKENMGTSDSTKLNSVAGFNNFFFFVSAADPRMTFHYLALNLNLKNAQSYDETMRQAAKDGHADDAYQAALHVLYYVTLMNPILDDTRTETLKAASIYQVPLYEIDSGAKKYFDVIGDAFADGVMNTLKSMAAVGGNDRYFQDADINTLWGSELYKLIYDSSFTYRFIPDTGEGDLSGIHKGDQPPTPVAYTTKFVSFVNFGKFAFHKWDGLYGGDGAIDTASFQFLDF